MDRFVMHIVTSDCRVLEVYTIDDNANMDELRIKVDDIIRNCIINVKDNTGP